MTGLQPRNSAAEVTCCVCFTSMALLHQLVL